MSTRTSISLKIFFRFDTASAAEGSQEEQDKLTAVFQKGHQAKFYLFRLEKSSKIDCQRFQSSCSSDEWEGAREKRFYNTKYLRPDMTLICF